MEPQDTILTRLFNFAGPDDSFVFAFWTHAIGYLAFDYEATASFAGIARISRFFARAFQEAHAKIVLPKLDKCYAVFVEAYEAWTPRLVECSCRRLVFQGLVLYLRPSACQGFYPFEPLRVCEGAQVAMVSIRCWNKLHILPKKSASPSQEIRRLHIVSLFGGVLVNKKDVGWWRDASVMICGDKNLQPQHRMVF
jgi:hypothetical protein